MSARTPRTKNLALALLAMTQFVIVIDASIVNVALPSIGAHLHFSRTTSSRSVMRSGSRSSRPSPTAAPKACSMPAFTARPWP